MLVSSLWPLTPVIMQLCVQQVLSCLLLSACRVNHSDAVHPSIHWALARLLFLHQSPVWRLWLSFQKQASVSKESLLKWRTRISQRIEFFVFFFKQAQAVCEKKKSTLFTGTWKGFKLSFPCPYKQMTARRDHLIKLFSVVNSGNMAHCAPH